MQGFPRAPGRCLELNGQFSQDPLFTSQSTFDFSLQAGSPCRSAGADLSGQGVVWDFNHQPRPTGAGIVSMGAFQYGTTVAGTGAELVVNLNMTVGTLPLSA